VMAAWSRDSGPGLYRLFEVDRTVSGVSLRCDPQRIDDPEGTHDLRIDDFDVIEEDRVSVSYNATWQGVTNYGGSKCSVEFFAEDGTVAFESEEFEIIGGGTQGSENMRLAVPSGASSEPTEARGVCRPWSP
jgi:hypothetical protein